MIVEIITGGISIIAGAFFITLAIFGWEEATLFLEPKEIPSMKTMLFCVGCIGILFTGTGLHSLINI